MHFIYDLILCGPLEIAATYEGKSACFQHIKLVRINTLSLPIAGKLTPSALLLLIKFSSIIVQMNMYSMFYQ